MTVEYIKLQEQEMTGTRTYPEVPEMESKLFTAGWLKVVKAAAEPLDRITQVKASAPTYTLSGENLVIRAYPVTDKPLAQAQSAKAEWVREQAQTVILGQYPLWMQSNCSLGIYASAVSDPIKAHIANIIAESNTCEDAVEAAETVDAVRAISPDWPEE
jgi:hypothetical protein